MNQKAYDARRKDLQGAKGNLYGKTHPGYDAERMRKRREELKKAGLPSTFAQLIDQQMNPLEIASDNAALAGDWHIPFVDYDTVTDLFAAAEEHGTKTLLVPGDFWDCDNFSKFIKQAHTTSFEQEVENVAFVMDMLADVFDKVYFCRGNHENRWMNLTNGMSNMEGLFAHTMNRNLDYEVTRDDHMVLHQGEEKWYVCHPKSFRQVNLSVAKDLAAKKLCNIASFHGHQWAQGRDRSGKFKLLDGGGMFNKHALAYLRDSTTYPETRGGFYILKDNKVYPYEGK